MKYFLKTLSGQADFLARRRIEYQAVLCLGVGPPAGKSNSCHQP
jgi:hypothetical protein